MQIDMHYYGTYVLARAAGINEATALVIAAASQFVDDSVETIQQCVFKDGSRLSQVVTAHHALSIANTSKDDQRYVWVPFHFLPGGGDGKGDTFEKRLICRRDSRIARQMFDNAIANSGKEFGAELIGIAAHVYADTFSHCGFSGISSKYNEIKNKSINLINMEEFPDHIKEYIGIKLKRKFLDRIRELAKPVIRFFSFAAENFSRGLGHGGVVSFPDIPFLKWNFIFEDGRPGYASGDEDNSLRFLQGCGELFAYFRKYAADNPPVTDKTAVKNIKNFLQIKKDILAILTYPGNKEDRIKKWQEYYLQNRLINSKGKTIPEYNVKNWTGNLKDICGTNMRDAVNRNLYHFYQGAEFHRTYVLRELLPGHGIFVI
jgi:hypothetical protein